MPATSEEAEAEAERIMAELLAMVRRDPNPGTEHFAAYLAGDRERTRAIGKRLYELGGHRLMLLAHERVEREAPPFSAEHLAHAWDGVGMWQS